MRRRLKIRIFRNNNIQNEEEGQGGWALTDDERHDWRLDEDSEGMVLRTRDGAHQIAGVSGNVAIE